MREYLTITSPATYEYVIERSRFISLARVVTSVDEAKAFIDEVRGLYPMATHYCYAYITDIGGNEMRFSDDGEPQGTAGMPMLEVIRKRNLRQVCVVSVRYFGGIKLGANGLVGAYVKSCSGVLDLCGVSRYAPSTVVRVSFDYTHLRSVERYLMDQQVIVEDKIYDERVTLVLCIQQGQEERHYQVLRDTCLGNIDILEVENKYVGYPM